MCAVGFAFDVSKAQEYILKGEYLSAQAVCNKCLETKACPAKDEALYFLGEAYFSAGEYAIAREQFALLRKEYPHSFYSAKSLIRIGDSYFLEAEYKKAYDIYQDFLRVHSSCGMKNSLYLRLAYTCEKLGMWDKKKHYMELLKKSGPDSLEYPYVDILRKRGFVFYIQIGAFTSKKNAHNSSR